MKKLTLLIGILLVFSCNNKQNKKTITTENTNTSKVDNSKIGRNNYAVVWRWATKDIQLVQDNWETISTEMNNLWKKDIITDVYYNSDFKIDKFEYFPNVSFFIMSKTYEDAELVLNKLTLVKKGIATYSIYPVGTKWLDRKGDKVHENGLTKSYVTLWTTINKEKATEVLIKAQSDAILKLWNDGAIENVYFDIEGTQKPNSITDFVFFINVNSKEDALQICDKLPFVKEKIASYKIHDVGIFWLGKFKNN